MTLDKPTLESAKEVGRYILFGVVAFVVTALLEKLQLMEQTDIQVIVATAVLRYADKYLHESKKAVKGLSRF